MTNNPNQPQSDDVVLGGQNPAPIYSSVLGGIEGVRWRLASACNEQRIAALKEALQYGQDGLDLIVEALKDPSREVQSAAYSLLTRRTEPEVKQAFEECTLRVPRLLVVDKHPLIRNLLVRSLSRKNYRVQSAQDRNTARVLFDQFRPDLVILNVDLPEELDYNLCEEMRSNTEVFILLLTSVLPVPDNNQGLLKWCDYFLTKPVDLSELETLVKVLLTNVRYRSQSRTKGSLAINHSTLL